MLGIPVSVPIGPMGLTSSQGPLSPPGVPRIEPLIGAHEAPEELPGTPRDSPGLPRTFFIAPRHVAAYQALKQARSGHWILGISSGES